MAQLNYIGQGAALGLAVTQKTPSLRLELESAGHAGGMSQKVHAHKHGSCNGLSKIDWAELLRGARLINRGDDHRWNGCASPLPRISRNIPVGSRKSSFPRSRSCGAFCTDAGSPCGSAEQAGAQLRKGAPTAAAIPAPLVAYVSVTEPLSRLASCRVELTLKSR